MTIWPAGVVVVAAGLWLVGLAAAIAAVPARAARLLESFAGSARAHYTEQAVRLVAGAAIVLFAPQMRFPSFFLLFGWVLVVTAIGLALVPWRWHHRFAAWVVPVALRHLWLVGAGALALGALILYAALWNLRPGAA